MDRNALARPFDPGDRSAGIGARVEYRYPPYRGGLLGPSPLTPENQEHRGLGLGRQSRRYRPEQLGTGRQEESAQQLSAARMPDRDHPGTILSGAVPFHPAY